jgi:glutathione S-transferase
MKLYTCGVKKAGWSIGHPCGKAAHALDEAGHTYELEAVGGYKNVPFTSGGGKRDHIIELTGQREVPVLVLDDGEAIAGSKVIVAWAKANPA